MCEALRTYLKKRRLKISAAARELGENRETFRTWLNGAVPHKEKVIKIFHWSKGAVQPNDFYDLSDPGPLNALPLFAANGNTSGGRAEKEIRCEGGP